LWPTCHIGSKAEREPRKTWSPGGKWEMEKGKWEAGGQATRELPSAMGLSCHRTVEASARPWSQRAPGKAVLRPSSDRIVLVTRLPRCW